MIKNLIVSTFVFAVGVLSCMAEHYDVYLLGGQSNGNGRADAARLSAPLDLAQPDVRFYWHRTQEANNVGHLVEDQWIDLAPGSGHGTGEPVYAKEFGSELSFGREMADANPGKNIAIIKYTHGGTNLAFQWAATGTQYTTFVSTVEAGLSALTTAGHTYQLKGMLWQQGEADTGSANSSNYQANLTNFISRVRTDLFGGKALPFVLGTISDSQYGNITTPGSGPNRVRKAQEEVAASDPAVGIVITDGYSTRPADSIHFDHTAMISLGREFAVQMASLGKPACSDRPNVILVLGDDQSWYDYSFMYRPGVEKAALDANPSIRQVAKTPAIDRLVDEGLAFTHGYATPLCRPSLASIITGTYPHQHRITGNDLENRPPDEAVEARMQVLHPLPHTLNTRLGYTSFQTGKWWEGHFSNGGFTAGDTANSTASGTAPPQWGGGRPSYATARHGDWGLMVGRVDYVNDIANPDHPIPYANTVQTVTDFIDAQRDASQPFFLWYAPFLPHTPHDPPAGLLAEYTALGLSGEDARYYANVERFDGGVGAILDHLDATGLAENTIIVMICDNGRDMDLGKRTPYEGGVRTPVIIRWPQRIRPGGDIEPGIVTTPVSLVDMVPTIHHAVGLPVFPEMTGVNLLDPAEVAARETLLGEDYDVEILDLDDPTASLESRTAIRDGWKLILLYNRETGTNGSPELYHLYDTATGAPIDPFEETNLAAGEAALVSELSTAIENWYDAPKGQQVSSSEAASFVVASDDLLQTSLDATTPVTTTGNFTEASGISLSGEPALRNGSWEDDIDGRGDAISSNGNTATYRLDLDASPLGYTIQQIDLFSNWGPAQGRDEIHVSIDYSVAASPENFDNHIVIGETYDPPTLSQGKMSISNIGSSGIAAIRFTWPASQENGGVGYSEIDVIGTPDGSETNPPEAPAFSPANGTSKVSLDRDLAANFCEPVKAGNGLIRLYRRDGSLVESFDVTDSPRLTFSATRVTIDPSAELEEGQSYYVQIDSTAIEDLSGNAYAGVSGATTWSFTAGLAGTATNLIHHWPLDGNANDMVGSHDGTAQGDATFTMASGGKFGEAVSLDGDGDFISTASSSLPSTDFSLTAWIRSSDTSDFNYIAGSQQSGNEGAFLRVDDGVMFFNLLPPAASKRASGGMIANDRWTHLAVTVSSTEGLKIFIDGSVVGSDPSGTGHDPFGNFTIGARPDGGTFGFNGLIDDVAIFNGVISETQLLNVINNGAEGFNANDHSFSSWIADPVFGLEASDRDFNADPDGDHLSNGLEAWFGTHPGQYNAGLRSVATDGVVTTFIHPQSENPLTDLSGYYEWSPNLIDWYAGDGESGPSDGSTVDISESLSGGIATVTVTATSSGTRRSLFLRAGVLQD